jgi:hypothetical protein
VVYDDFVVVIWMKAPKSNGKLEAADFVTAYVADHSINKIKNSPKWGLAEVRGISDR